MAGIIEKILNRFGYYKRPAFDPSRVVIESRDLELLKIDSLIDPIENYHWDPEYLKAQASKSSITALLNEIKPFIKTEVWYDDRHQAARVISEIYIYKKPRP